MFWNFYKSMPWKWRLLSPPLALILLATPAVLDYYEVIALPWVLIAAWAAALCSFWLASLLKRWEKSFRKQFASLKKEARILAEYTILHSRGVDPNQSLRTQALQIEAAPRPLKRVGVVKFLLSCLLGLICALLALSAPVGLFLQAHYSTTLTNTLYLVGCISVVAAVAWWFRLYQHEVGRWVIAVLAILLFIVTMWSASVSDVVILLLNIGGFFCTAMFCYLASKRIRSIFLNRSRNEHCLLVKRLLTVKAKLEAPSSRNKSIAEIWSWQREEGEKLKELFDTDTSWEQIGGDEVLGALNPSS